MKEYHQLDEIQKDLQNGTISCESLTNHYLGRIEAHEELNAFIEIYADEALVRAREIDQKISNNSAGKFAGLVFGAKDLLCYKDHKVSGSSKILKGYESLFTSTAVQHLLDQDAILIGRQNCDEFGMGSSNENSAYGPTRNAADVTRVPGGSSGGSAVAVQAGMCLASLGTDTGGSVRQPAAFCGVTGIKPTYSRVSRWGLLSYASSFDTIGVFSHSIEDAETILAEISGKDEKDATSSTREIRYSNDIDIRQWKVAFLGDSLKGEGIQAEIQEKLRAIKALLEAEKQSVSVVDSSLFKYALPTYYILTTAEASTNLSRYDGVHYGHRSENSEALEALYKNSRTEGFGDEVRRRILLGTFVLSAEYHDAYFKKAQEVRSLIKAELLKILNDNDVIILPTTPTTAFTLGEKSSDPLEMYMADLFTVIASVAGIPAISIPVGTDQNGLPIGMQIMSNAFREDKIFAFSKYLVNKIDQSN